MKIETATELFALKLRGNLARMFDHRGVEPTEAQWKMLRGEQEISLRDISDIAHDLGFEVSTHIGDRQPLDADAA